MGKLRFKGEKPKKKRKLTSSKEEEQVHLSSVKKTKQSIDLDNASGWTTSLTINDLNGPCIVLANQNDTPAVLSFVENEDIQVSKELDINQDSINFFDEDEEPSTNYPRYHSVEPSLINQVLAIFPINPSAKSTLNAEKTNKFAFKNFKNKYLSINPTSSALETSFAITDSSIFELTPISKCNDEYNINETYWEIKTCDKKYCLVFDSDSFKFTKSSETTDGVQCQFLIRIQIKNSSKFKLFNLLKDQESNNDIKRVVIGLYKETNGKIKVTNDLIKRLKESIKAGNLNEQIIEEKSKVLSKW